MAFLRGFIGATLDGYIAAPDGSLDFTEELGEIGASDTGYDRFIAEISVVVMGRKTYDHLRSMLDGGWPFQGKSAIVLTHRPIEDLPADCEIFEGNIAPLIDRLRSVTDGDVWIAGGSQTQQAFLEADGLDRIEIHLLPLLLGDGIPLWPESQHRARLSLRSVTPLTHGMVALDYDIRPA